MELNETLFKYLKKNGIFLNDEDFNYQVQSHPDYPSLLSIMDTLFYYNIHSLAIRVEKQRIGELPETFLIILKDKQTIVERFENGYILKDIDGTKKITSSQLEEIWPDIVFLIDSEIVEKSSTNDIIETKNLKSIKSGLMLLAIVALFFMFWLSNSYLIVCLGILSIIGVYVSIETINVQLGLYSNLTKAICSSNSRSDCSSIINTNKGIFRFVSLSDLSFCYFTSICLGLFFFSVWGKPDFILSTMYYLSIATIPVILYSLYFQYKVEKHWCPLCLSIILVLSLQLLIFLFLVGPTLNFHVQSFTIFSFVYLFVATMIYILKPYVKEYYRLRAFSITSNRFIRNYDIFKNQLISSNKTSSFISEGLMLGNTSAALKITVITSLLCYYCKDLHLTIQKILDEFKSDLGIELRFNMNSATTREEKDLYYRIYEIYKNKGEEEFLSALGSWQRNNDFKAWFLKHGKPSQDIVGLAEEKLLQVTKENFEKGFHFTPNLFINNYNFPKIYDRDLLKGFVFDLVEDDFFVKR